MPTQVSSSGPSLGGSAQQIVAEIMAETNQVNKAAEPSKKQAQASYIEQALSQSVDSTDFAATVEYWKQFEATLPKDSPLKSYAEAQVNLLVNNPKLLELEKSMGKDGKALKDALAHLQDAESLSNKLQSALNTVERKISEVKSDMEDHWDNPVRVAKDVAELVGLEAAKGALELSLLVVQKVIEPLISAIYGVGGLESKVQDEQLAIDTQKQLLLTQSKTLSAQFGEEGSGVVQQCVGLQDELKSQDGDMTTLGKLFDQLNSVQK